MEVICKFNLRYATSYKLQISWKTTCSIRKQEKDRQKRREIKGLYKGLQDSYMSRCTAAITQSMTRTQPPLCNDYKQADYKQTDYKQNIEKTYREKEKQVEIN